jgi:L-histidine Nalpha-methyltransferase / hercynylcysteine S-oxide synthase
LLNCIPRFILNGLAHANRLFGEELFNRADWKVIGEYVYDADGGRHRAFVTPNRQISVLGVDIRPQERIHIEHSFKYSDEGKTKLWRAAGLAEINRWMYGEEHGTLTYRLKMAYTHSRRLLHANVNDPQALSPNLACCKAVCGG